jgi:hypothetical protein
MVKLEDAVISKWKNKSEKQENSSIENRVISHTSEAITRDILYPLGALSPVYSITGRQIPTSAFEMAGHQMPTRGGARFPRQFRATKHHALWTVGDLSREPDISHET